MNIVNCKIKPKPKIILLNTWKAHNRYFCDLPVSGVAGIWSYKKIILKFVYEINSSKVS